MSLIDRLLMVIFGALAADVAVMFIAGSLASHHGIAWTIADTARAGAWCLLGLLFATLLLAVASDVHENRRQR